MNIQEIFSGLITDQQFGEAINKQHYSFVHVTMPYIVKNHFHDLIGMVNNDSAQDWILQIWCDSSEILNSDYAALVYPKCHLIKPSDEIGIILISMPDPRVPTEAAYTAVVFAEDKYCSPSEWLRYYFTLELGLDSSAYWVLGAWDDSNHLNLGKFEYEPTIENFLSVVLVKGQKMWK